jgi:hypothetical protein
VIDRRNHQVAASSGQVSVIGVAVRTESASLQNLAGAADRSLPFTEPDTYEEAMSRLSA